MRVLVVTNMYPPHSYGGYELSCRDVVRRWRAAGHQVEVLTSDLGVAETCRSPESTESRGGPDGPDRPSGGDDEAGVRRQLRLYWEDHAVVSPPLLDRWRRERANARALGRAIREVRPEVVSVWAMGGLSLGLLTRVGEQDLPLVSVICDEWPIYGPEVDAWMRPLFRRPRLAAVVGAVTHLPTRLPDLEHLGPACFVSEFLREACRRRSPWRFPCSGLVYSGIAADDFSFDESVASRRFGWRLLYVGRIDPRKGITTAVEALALLPAEATLSIYGDGESSHLAALRALAARLGLGERVRFSTSDRQQLASVYRAADAVVFPSSWEEPFGLVPLEAMASGTPVVAVPSGGSAEYLRDQVNCLAIGPGDPAAMAGAVRRLSGDPDLRRRLAAGGRVSAGALGVDELAEVLEHWHRWILGNGELLAPADRELSVGGR